MEDLSDIRKEIDSIDTQIVELFKRRMSCADAVAAYKRAHDLPVLDRSRERELLSRRAAQVPEDMKVYTEVLFELLMEASRNRQGEHLGTEGHTVEQIRDALAHSPELFPRDAYVACQGVEGAYQQIATDRIFRHANIGYFDTFDAVFRAVEENYADFGVLPIENSTAGSVNQVFDPMMRHNFHIVRTCRLKVDHNLLAKPGCGLGEIRHIYSHEQAINQCGEFLSSLEGVTVHACENTAMASKMVAESERRDVAALASRACARIYGLDVLASSVQDQGNNYTRFACISKDLAIYPGADRSTFMLVVNHEPGALYKVLAKFYDLDINIIKLESRPIPDRDFEFMFYFDIDCPAASPEFFTLVRSLESTCEEFRYLGSYSEVI
ncbi:bifunctional chorismate mutase/prephenate dehydratase [Olsenella umbonata]|uniref:Bifunctional chorismate mutase/prephenate dehydratase n=1 Tax=Parafannyhessea umbonata TaxID=604330 RepID=A0A7X9Y030_9ACTN|nr:bifunctional chorismate mutase/prephenate dehydratase [Parafannyhessea umbonata]NMF26006.1 bifunctional chorismate mutase/prephenate dehydratase [Parafannyhessea umbonata]